MTDDLTSREYHFAQTVPCLLPILLPMVFAIAHIGGTSALEIGVSGAAAGLSAGVSADIGSKGLSAGADIAGNSSRASAGASVGSSGVSGGLGANVGAIGASATGALGPSGVGAGAGLSSGNGGGGAPGLSGGAGQSSGANAAPANGSSNSIGSSHTGGSHSGGISTGPGSSRAGTDRHADQDAPREERTTGLTARAVPGRLTASASSTSSNSILPGSLWPVGNGSGDSGWFQSIHLLKPLQAKPGTPLDIVQSCRNALVPGALHHGAVQVDVASAGRTTRLKDGSLSAPVEARVVFQRGARVQVRQARVTCRLDAGGRTIAIS
jgi:hypothetical protein